MTLEAWSTWYSIRVVRSSPGSKTAGERDDAGSMEYAVLG
jgi:hypothetical protein